VSEKPRYQLSHAEKDALLADQARLIQEMAAEIERLKAKVTANGAKKTPKNSHTPPSQGQKANKQRDKPRKKRPSRPGVSRELAQDPDDVRIIRAGLCDKCGADVSGRRQTRRERYDFIDIPPVAAHVTRIELWGGRCPCCARRYRATPPGDMPPGTPFGPQIHALLLYLHHSQHVSFERLARLLGELFGLRISEGAISNALARKAPALEASRMAIEARLRAAEVVASDETTTRIDGVTHWHWVFVTAQAVLHRIAPRRARAVAEAVLDGHRPEVWISDRYAGQQELGRAHQVCLAHVLRDVQYAIDCGDTVTAPKIAKLLQWAVRVGRRRDSLADSTLVQYQAKADRKLDALLAPPAAHPAGRALQKKLKAWRTKFFVFLEDRRVPATNNRSEQEIRPTVIHRKVTNGFRSDWGADTYADYCSLTSTGRLHGHTVFDTIRALIAGRALYGMDRILPGT
jgi:transposase